MQTGSRSSNGGAFMNHPNFRSMNVAVLAISLALLAGCQAPNSAFGPLGAMQNVGNPSSRPHAATGEKVLFSFNGTDGEYPTSGLTQSNANGAVLYGTTATGGSDTVGTVYRVTAGGSHRVVRNFKAGRLSFSPAGALTLLNGRFYGAAAANSRCRSHHPGTCAGAIFAIDTSGKDRVVYAFKGGSDGAQPRGALTVLNGVLYGVTAYGGKYGQGIVFAITPSGSEKVLHSFVKPYGLAPTGSLVSLNGNLYGTTTSGGAHSYGTVFSITPSGTETVLHSFAGPPDGASPAAGLIEVGGMLYGTTVRGGGGPSDYCFLSRGNLGCGTLFSVDTSGDETVVHDFNGPPDGAFPHAGLTDVDGTLYGTTADGGAYRCTRGSECGTIFAVDTSGDETVVHDFSGPPDGATPYAGLTYADGTLYGTTEDGGSGACVSYDPGCGTVFSVAPLKHRSRTKR
jgi:uncharacterized repeat protein (TIGR03803 family)